MNKAEFITKVRDNSEYSKAQIESVLDSVIDTIMDVVASGDSVNFVGFGKFETRERSARTGVNPRTGEKIEIDAVKTPAFKAGKVFKDKVREDK